MSVILKSTTKVAWKMVKTHVSSFNCELCLFNIVSVLICCEIVIWQFVCWSEKSLSMACTYRIRFILVSRLKNLLFNYKLYIVKYFLKFSDSF